MSFCHSSDCHTVVFYYVMTLFRRLAPPYLSQLYCHHSFRHTSHASALFTASSHSLSLSVLFRVPPLPDCTDCYDRPPFISIPFITCSIPSHTDSIPRRRRLPRLPCVFRSATSSAGARLTPSADRHSTSYVPSSNNGASAGTHASHLQLDGEITPRLRIRTRHLRLESGKSQSHNDRPLFMDAALLQH